MNDTIFKKSAADSCATKHRSWVGSLAIAGFYAGLAYYGLQTAKDIAKTTVEGIQHYKLSQLGRTSFVLAGFKADGSDFLSYASTTLERSNAEADQLRYLAVKAELDAALNACKADPQFCPPHISALSSMIEQVRKIPDRLTQVQLVNGWVNLAIKYDHAEANKIFKGDPKGFFADETYLTPFLSTVDGKGVCKEQAWLKAIILERLKFAQKDFRFISLADYKNGQVLADSGHAVVAVRVNKRNWIMNNQASYERQPVLSPWQAEDLMELTAKVELDTTFFNPAIAQYGWSGDKAITRMPIATYNSSFTITYSPQPVPSAVENAKASDRGLNIATASAAELDAYSRILLLPLGFHHSIKQPRLIRAAETPYATQVRQGYSVEVRRQTTVPPAHSKHHNPAHHKPTQTTLPNKIGRIDNQRMDLSSVASPTLPDSFYQRPVINYRN